MSNEDQAQAPAAAPDAGIQLDMSKSVPLGAQAAPQPDSGIQLDMSKSVPVGEQKPEESWFHQNVAGPFMNDVHRIKNAILENTGPGWLPYDALTAMGVKKDTTGPFAGIDWNKEIPKPAAATDAEAEAAIKNKAVLPGTTGGYVPKTVDEAKKGIDYLRSQQRAEQIFAHEYEAKGENRLISPERLMTGQEAKEHPVLYGLLHFTGQLTTEDNALIMAGTGGLGFVSEAAAVSPQLGVLAKTVAATPRLVSAYFAGQMAIGAGQTIPGLYEAKKDYDEAVKAGDADAAARIKWDATVHATEAAAQGYASYAAAYHAATGRAEPVASYAAESTKETLAAMGDTAQTMGANAAAGVRAGAKAVKQTAGQAVEKAGALIGRTNDFETAVQRAAKVTPKRAAEIKQTIGDTNEDLQAIVNANPDIESPKDFADAIEEHLQQQEAHMQREAGATKDENVPVHPDFRGRISDRLDQFFDDNRGKFGSPEEVEQAKKDVLDRVMQRDQIGTDTDGAPIYQERVPNLFESENTRQGLNNETKPQYATNAKPTTDAYKAGAAQAVSEVRDIIDGSYHERGIENVQEFREKEAKLIKIEEALRNAQAAADKAGEGTVFQSLMKKIGVPSTVIAIAMGHPVGGAAIGAAVLGDQIHQNITNPNVNVGRAVDLAARNPGASATKVELNPNAPGPAPAGSAPPRPTPPPVDHATYAALSSYYGKIIGSVPYDKLVSDFQKEIQDVHEKKATGTYTAKDEAMEPRRQAMLDKLNAAKMKQRVDAEKLAQKQAADAAKAQARATAEQKKAEEKKAADEEARRQEAIKTGVVPKGVNPHLEALGRGDESGLVSHSPAMKAHAPATEIKAPEGMTSEDVHRHEWAHVAVGAVDGLEPIEIRSNEHPESRKAAATSMFNVESLKDAGGNTDPEAMANQEVQWLTHKMAGPASHEIFNGLTYDEVKALPGARTDFRQAREIVRQVHPDFTPKQVEDTITAAYDRARDFLTMPHIADRIRANASVREEGLSPTLHASRGRITQFAEDIRNAHNEYTGTESGPDGGGAGEGGEKSETPKPEGKKNGGADKERPGEGASGAVGKNAAASGRVEVKPVELTESERKANAASKLTPEERKELEKKTGKTESGIPIKEVGRVEVKEGEVTPVETKPLLDTLRGSNVDKAAGALLTFKEARDLVKNEKAQGRDAKFEPVYGKDGETLGYKVNGASGTRSDTPEYLYSAVRNEDVTDVLAGKSKGVSSWGTEELANHYKQFGNRTVLKVPIKRFDPALLKPDLNAIKEPIRGEAEYEEHPSKAFKKTKKQWQDSYNLVDSAAYHGNLLPEDVGGSNVDRAAKGLKERSTGNEADDAAIKAGGGIPGGRMSMDENNHVRMFHDPQTGTTLGFSAKEEVTPEAVKAKLAESRKQYGIKPEEVGGSQVSLRDQHTEEENRLHDEAVERNRPEIAKRNLESAPEWGIKTTPEGELVLYHGTQRGAQIRASGKLNQGTFLTGDQKVAKQFANAAGSSSRRAEVMQVKVPAGTVLGGGANGGYFQANEEIPLKELTPEEIGGSQVAADRVSTRVPEGKDSKENPLEGEPLVVGREALRNTPEKLQQKFADTVRDYPGVKIPASVKDPQKVMDRFVSHVKDNLQFLYNQVEPEKQAANAKWYESANKLSKELAEKHGISEPQAAATIATQSPQKDWDMNVSLARRIADIHANHQDTVATPEMIQKGHDIVKNTGANKDLDSVISKLEGKKLSELTDPFERAAWVRLYDEAHNPREFHYIDPGTGENRGLRTNANGAPSKVAWGTLPQIDNALSVLKDGSRENISNRLGGMHKVRNFYNNIIDPTNDQDVTIDTHAVAAGLIQPLGGNAPEVLDNFGKAGKHTGTGVKGTYPLYAEAYRQAAKELGILPRELQSVVWEHVRNMFPSEWKSPENEKVVKKIWQKYSDGKQNLNQTRQQILQLSEEAQRGVNETREAAQKKALDNIGKSSFAQEPESTYSVPSGWTKTGPTKAPGLIQPGNINLTTRPIVRNDDGTTSSEYSTSFQDEKGREVIVPTVVDGKFLTPDGKKPKVGSPEEAAMKKAAWQHYLKTGQHLGIYDTPEHADAAAEAIHNRPPVKKALDKQGKVGYTGSESGGAE